MIYKAKSRYCRATVFVAIHMAHTPKFRPLACSVPNKPPEPHARNATRWSTAATSVGSPTLTGSPLIRSSTRWRLDFGATATAGGDDPKLEAVGAERQYQVATLIKGSDGVRSKHLSVQWPHSARYFAVSEAGDLHHS